MDKNINAMYFSPTGTTKKIAAGLAGKISAAAGGQTAVKIIDFTLPGARKETVSFTAADLVVFGVPVYAGRVPNILLKYINSITGNGALAVAVVLYGNRDYDDALIELKDILELNGFQVIAACAFIGEHSISKILAKDRPDEKDMAVVDDFAAKIYAKILAGNYPQSVTVKGNKPYRKYYMPLDEHGRPVDFRVFVPKTSSDCMDCKLCAAICPVGSINYDDVAKLDGICIKCGACVKNCPNEAKYFDDKDFLRHKHELEVEFTARKEPELFL